jgi:hypothetical protein
MLCVRCTIRFYTRIGFCFRTRGEVVVVVRSLETVGDRRLRGTEKRSRSAKRDYSHLHLTSRFESPLTGAPNPEAVLPTVSVFSSSSSRIHVPPPHPSLHPSTQPLPLCVLKSRRLDPVLYPLAILVDSPGYNLSSSPYC